MMKCLSLILSFCLIFSSVTPSIAQINQSTSRPQIPFPQTTWERDGVQQAVAIDEYNAKIKRSAFELQFTQVDNKQSAVIEEMNTLLRQMEQAAKDEETQQQEPQEEMLTLEEFEKVYRDANLPELKKALKKARTAEEKERYKKAFEELLDDTSILAYQKYVTQYGAWKAQQERAQAQAEKEFKKYLHALCDKAATIESFISKGYRTELVMPDRPVQTHSSVDPISVFLPSMYESFGEEVVSHTTRTKASAVLRRRLEQMNGVQVGTQDLLQNAHALAVLGTSREDAFEVAHVLLSHFNDPGVAPAFINTLGADLVAMKDVAPDFQPIQMVLLNAKNKELDNLSVWDITPLKLENWVKAIHELAEGSEFATKNYINSLYKDNEPNPSCDNKPCANHNSAWMDWGLDLAKAAQEDASLRSVLESITEELVSLRRGKDGNPQLVTHNNFFLVGLLSNGFKLNLKGKGPHDYYDLQGGVSHSEGNEGDVQAALAQIKALGLTPSEYVAFVLYHQGYIDLDPATARYVRDWLTPAISSEKREALGMHSIGHTSKEEIENYEMWQKVQSNFAFADKVLAFVAEFIIFWVLTDGILAVVSNAVRFGSSFVRAVRLSTTISRGAKGSLTAGKLVRFMKIAGRVSSGEKMALKVGGKFSTSAAIKGGTTEARVVEVTAKGITQRAASMAGKNIFTYDGMTYFVGRGFKNVLVRTGGRVEVQVVEESLSASKIAQRFGVAAEDVLEVSVKDGKVVGKALDWLKGGGKVAQESGLNYTAGGAGVHEGAVSMGTGANAGVTEGLTPLSLQNMSVVDEMVSPLSQTVTETAITSTTKALTQSGKWWQQGWKWLDETVIHWRPLNSATPGFWRGAWDRTNYFLRIQAPDFFSQVGRLASTRQGATVFGTSLTPAFATNGLNATAGTALVAEANLTRNAITVAETGMDLLTAPSVAGVSAVSSEGVTTLAELYQMGIRTGVTGALSFNLSPWWAPENQVQTPLNVSVGSAYKNWWRNRESYLTAQTKAKIPSLDFLAPVSVQTSAAVSVTQDDSQQAPAAQTNDDQQPDLLLQPMQGPTGQQGTAFSKTAMTAAAAAAAAAIVGSVVTGNPAVSLAGIVPISVAGLFGKGKKDASQNEDAGAAEEGDQFVSIPRPLNRRQRLLQGIWNVWVERFNREPGAWFDRLMGKTADVYNFSYVDVVYNTATKKIRLADDQPLQEGEHLFRVAKRYGFIAPQVIPQSDLDAIIQDVTAKKEKEAEENHTTVTDYELDQAIEEAKGKHLFSIMTRQADTMAEYILNNEFATRANFVWIFASAASEEMKIKASLQLNERGWKGITLQEVLAERVKMMNQPQLQVTINAGNEADGSFNIGQKQVDDIVTKVNARAQEENKGQLVPQSDPVLSQGLTARELTSIDPTVLTEVLRPAEGVEKLLIGTTHETNGGNTVYEKMVPVYLRDASGKETDTPRLYLMLNKPFVMPRGFHLVLDESGHFKVSIANLREVEATSWLQPYNLFFKWLYKIQPDFFDKLPWVKNNPKRLRDWDSSARKRVFETPLKASELTALNYILSERTDQVAVLPTAEADQFESVMNLVAIVAGADLGASLSSQMKKTISVLALVLLLTGFGYISPKIANLFKGKIKRNGSYKAFQTGFLTMLGLSLAGMIVPGAVAASGASGWDAVQAFFQGGMFGMFKVGTTANLAFASLWMMAAIITASVFSTLAGPTLKSGYPDNTVFSSKNMGFTTMKGLSRFGVAFLGGTLFKLVMATTGVDLNWSVLVPVMGFMSYVGLKKLKNSRIYKEHQAQQADKRRREKEAAAEASQEKDKEDPVASALELPLQKEDPQAIEKQKKAESERKYKELFAKPLSPITKRLGLIYLTYAFVNSVVIGSLGGMLFSSPLALVLTGAGLFISWLVRKGADKLIKSRVVSEDQLTGISLPLMSLGVLGSLLSPFGSPEMLLSWLAMFVATPTFGVSENTRMMNYVAAYYKAERAKVSKDPSLSDAEKEKRIRALNEEETGQKLNASAAYNKYNAWGIYAVLVGIAMAVFRDFGIMNIPETMESLGHTVNGWGIKGTGMGVWLQHAFEKLQEYSLTVVDGLRDFAGMLRLGGDDSSIFIQDGWTADEIAAQQAKAPIDFAVYRLGMVMPAITSIILLLKNKGMIKEGIERIVSSVVLTPEDIEKGENIPQQLHINFDDVGSLTAEVSKEVDDLNTAVRAFINSRTSEERLQGWANRMVWVNNRLKALAERSPLLANRVSGELLKMKELSGIFYDILIYNDVSDALKQQGGQIKESFAGVSKVNRSSKVVIKPEFVYLPEIKLSFFAKLAQWIYRVLGWGTDPAKGIFSQTKIDHYEYALMNMREMNTMLKEAEGGTITDDMFKTFQGLYDGAIAHLESYLKQNKALGQTEIDSRIRARKEDLDKIYRQFMNKEPSGVVKGLEP